MESTMQQFFTPNKPALVSSNRILYTPSSFARTNLLHIQEIGELTAKHPHRSSRSNLSSYLFFSITYGSGKLVYDGKNFSLNTGDMVFIDCAKPYSHTTSPDNLWTLRWIHFYGSSLPAIYDKYCERGGRPVFHPKHSDPFDHLWTQLMEMAGSSDYIRDMKINAALNQLMVEIMAESWHPENQDDLPKKKSFMVPIKQYLDDNFSEKITLDGLASQFYLNKYYLAKTFKEQYGQSINAYLLNLRITKAKQLLRFSEKTVEEIGFACGLGAAHYFSAKFKEVEGVPPSKYREQW